MIAGLQADDLTGACDTGAVFAARGLETIALLPDAPLPAPPPAVLVLDTESRSLPAAEARARAREAAGRLQALGPDILYKKLDSTLRGAVAAELAGALEGAGRIQALLAPAFPAQRRTVADGMLRIDGRPADETALVRDPEFPPTGASVLALLGAAGPHPVTLVPLATVRRGPRAVEARLRRWTEAGGGTLACDAESDADLAAVAAAAAGNPALLAGSAGLAAALAARLAPGTPKLAPRPRRPLLVIAGSAQPATQEQVLRLQAHGVPVLTAPAAAGGDRAAVVQELVASAKREVERTAPCTLLLTGGETAYSVCRALGATGIRLAGELEPGLALGALLDGPHAGLAVATKAGGFGGPDTLVRVLEACT